MLNDSDELFLIIMQTANEMAYWMNITPQNAELEIREKDYNRFKEYMRASLKFNNIKANRYRAAMEKLFSTMKIENDLFFGKIYISTWYAYNEALTVLVDLEMN